MRIAFVGRVGSGKTTCAAVLGRHLAAQGLPVLAIDAGADRSLGSALGVREALPPLPAWLDEHRPGGSADGMRRDGRIVDLDPAGELFARHTVAAPGGARLLAIDAVAPLLDQMADGEREYVVLDLAADAFSAGLCTRFDMTVLVAEPTRRDIGLYRQCAEKASGHGVELRVLGNKISDWGDTAWLTEQMGDALLGCVGHSAWVRAAERGTAGPVSGLEPGNTQAMAAVHRALDGCRRTWKTQQGDPAATRSQQDHPVGVATAYSASSR
jgi:CO dehydrogenase maturation factor